MTIYILTLKTTAQHDAEKRADLNLFLKKMKRTFGLKCVNIEEKEEKPKRAKRAKKPQPAVTIDVADITKRMREPDWRSR